MIEGNRLLRLQLRNRRLQLSDDDRRRLAGHAYRVGRRRLREIATIATPDTLLRWHRQLIAREWPHVTARGSRRRVLTEIRRLVVRMAAEDPTWGYTRRPRAVKALTSHRARSLRTESSDLVFGNRTGGPLRESKLLQNVLQPAAKGAGLGRMTWHQFRHIHSSLLNDLRVPVKIAQEQLGHASVTTTLNVYTHVVDASHRRAIESVEERLLVDLDSNGLESGKAETPIETRSASHA